MPCPWAFPGQQKFLYFKAGNTIGDGFMAYQLRAERLKPIHYQRERARQDFLNRFPQGLLGKVGQFRSLQIKANQHRRFMKASEMGTLESDIKYSAGFAYEGVEALSSEEAAMLKGLENSREIREYLAKEADFRRDWFREEEKAFRQKLASVSKK